MLCIIYKIAASGIITVLPIVFRVKKYDYSDPTGINTGLAVLVSISDPRQQTEQQNAVLFLDTAPLE